MSLIAGPSSKPFLVSPEPAPPSELIDPPGSIPSTIPDPHSTSAERTPMEAARVLPRELWHCAFIFLARDPASLLALCSTCWDFAHEVIFMIRKLRSYSIAPATYDNLQKVLEEIRESPSLAFCIQFLTLQDSSPGVSLTPLSALPHQLMPQLTNLTNFTIRNIHLQAHPSTWYLLGRTMPRVVYLCIEIIHVSSFTDFSSFVSSFPALDCLALDRVSCSKILFPPVVASGPRKTPLRLSTLILKKFATQEELVFLNGFVQWYFRNGAQIPRAVWCDTSTASLPVFSQLLGGIAKGLQFLYFRPSYEVNVIPWKEIFNVPLPELYHVEVNCIQESDVDLLRSIILCRTPEMGHLPDIIISFESGFYEEPTWRNLQRMLPSGYSILRTLLDDYDRLRITFKFMVPESIAFGYVQRRYQGVQSEGSQVIESE